MADLYAVPVVAVEGAFRRIDRNLMMIDAESIALRIAIRKQARLQHLVRREADAGHDGGRIEGGLFDFGKEIFRIAVEFKFADLDQRHGNASERHPDRPFPR